MDYKSRITVVLERAVVLRPSLLNCIDQPVLPADIVGGKMKKTALAFQNYTQKNKTHQKKPTNGKKSREGKLD